MGEHETGQLASGAADIYERFFVAALFIDWPPRLLAATDVQAGHRVLDVACGTGVLAREAARVVGRDGTVVGLDINEGMLAVARAKSADVTWQRAPAESLPFADGSFDRVVSQFGLMFFRDRAQAVSEMLRVVRPGGRIGVAVWAGLDATPGYAVVAEILEEMFGPEVSSAIEVPYSLGDTAVLKALFAAAGAGEITVETVAGKARFPSVESWIYTDIRGWTLADVIDDEGFGRLRREAPAKLSRFVLADGTVEFDAPAHLVTLGVT